jgi:hypothetical protein
LENLPKNKIRNLEDDGRAGESRQCAKMKGMRKMSREAREQKRMNRTEQVDRDGYAIVPAVVDELVVRDLLEQLGGSDLPRNRAGVRHMMKDPRVAQIASREEMIGIAREIVGAKAWPFRATSNENNGARRVPGTYQSGVLTAEEVLRLVGEDQWRGVSRGPRRGRYHETARDTRVVESYKRTASTGATYCTLRQRRLRKDWR